jgi:hypothetical protein
MSPSIFPTIGQINFANNYCAQLLQRSLTTHNFLGTGRDDVLTIRIITSLTRNQLIGVDQFYRTIKNPQNQSLPAKLETWGGSCGHFLSALSQSIESFHGSYHSFIFFLKFSPFFPPPLPISFPLKHCSRWFLMRYSNY